MEDGLVVKEAIEREVEVQEERHPSDASVGTRARFIHAGLKPGSTKAHQKRW
jgi:hypothetical protein